MIEENIYIGTDICSKIRVVESFINRQALFGIESLKRGISSSNNFKGRSRHTKVLCRKSMASGVAFGKSDGNFLPLRIGRARI